jgi:hypothetical protein
MDSHADYNHLSGCERRSKGIAPCGKFTAMHTRCNSENLLCDDSQLLEIPRVADRWEAIMCCGVLDGPFQAVGPPLK